MFMFSRLMAERRRGRSANAERRLREAVCQPLEERRLLSKTIYVDVNSPAPATNGPSWGTAYKDLQLALGVAVAGDTIDVGQGTYMPTSDTDRTISFQLKSGVAIYGGYAGYGAPNPDARDIAQYSTVLSGDIGIVGDNTDNSYHVVVGSGTTSTAALDGFTITDGTANEGSSSTYYGGGMCIVSGSPTLANCTFTGNSAMGVHGFGGGVYNDDSSPTLTNCIFSGNSASDISNVFGGGGGMYNDDSSPMLTNCTFTGNSAGGSAGIGGGMYNVSSSPTLTNCTFSGNSATGGGAHGWDGGGGIYDVFSSPTLMSCTFSGNIAGGSGGFGGGVYNSSSSPTLTNCTFNRNSASYGGGMCDVNNYGNEYPSSPILTNCTFNGNSASYDGYGGGMYNYDDSPAVRNCTFSGNSASFGGGGMCDEVNSLPTLTNCTFSENTAAGGGSAMYNDQGSSSTLTNCIVWGNNVVGGSQIYQSDGSPTITYSDIQGGWPGTGNINSDPLFIRNPSPGPDGQWGTPDDDYGDLHLQLTSPAIDAGNNAAVPAGISTDLAGDPRFMDVAGVADTGNGVPPIVDMGAYEAMSLLHVDPSASGLENGSSWADAYPDLTTALSAALPGSRILVASGIYRPTSGSDRSSFFQLKDDVEIDGGYAGDANSADPDARDIALYPTILSGDIGIAGDDTDNSYHVVVGGGTDSTAVLDGFTITAGNADGTGSDDEGGGMYNSAGCPTLRNCTFSGNAAAWGGGGLYDTSSSPTLTNCTLSGDTALGPWGYGGAITNDSSSSPTLTNCTISGNSASYVGGGMYNDYSSAPTLADCMFSGNSTVWDGGGMCDVSCSPTLTNCVFSGNTATGVSGSGGGMCNVSSSPMLTNCTFSGNAAGNSGGGMESSFSSSPTLTNCIVWGNTAGSESQLCQSGGTTTITYSDIQGGYTGTGNINAAPLFVRNPSPGSDGIWGTADDDYGNLQLQANSPCIDAGNNAAPGLAGVTTDLAGGPRFMDVLTTPDTGSGTAPIVDMGAYERKGLLTINGTIESGAYDVSLTPDQATLQIWTGSSAGCTPMASYPVATIDSCQFGTSAGSNTLTLDVSNGVPPVGLTFAAGGGNNTLILAGFSATNTVNIQTNQLFINSTVVATSNAETILLNAPAGSTLALASLTLSQPAALVAGKNLALRVGSLSITNPGSLDLAGNSMILDYTASPMPQVQQWINNGRIGVTPSLLTSVTAASGTPVLGMVDNALLHLASFAGQSLGGVFGQLLIQQTVAGDANLDGVVDDKDYLAVIANMGSANAQWFLGDLNGDGVVNTDDFAEVTAHLGNSLSGVSGTSASEATGGTLMAAAQTTKVAARTKAGPVAAATVAKVKAKVVVKGNDKKGKRRSAEVRAAMPRR
jgi:parallel beta-helix repeat protein